MKKSEQKEEKKVPRIWIVFICVGIFFLLLIVIFVLFLIKGTISIFQEATPIAEDFYSRLQKEDYAEIENLFHYSFFEESPKEELVPLFKAIDNQLGKIKSFSFTHYTYNTYSNKRKVITLQYKIDRTNHTSLETITFVKNKNEENYLIVRYYVQSKGFIPDLITGKTIDNLKKL